MELREVTLGSLWIPGNATHGLMDFMLMRPERASVIINLPTLERNGSAKRRAG